MRLSIIIPCHDRTDLLAACLRCVLAHAPEDAEIIVVDDASLDRKVALAAEALPRVQVLRLPKRGGFCVAVNAGVRHARGDVVALLNDDTEIQPGWAEPALRHFQRPEIAAVASLILAWPRGDRIDSAGDLYHPAGWARKRGRGQPLEEPYLRPGPIYSACACSAFYRRSALLAAGGFPEEFGAYFDDVEVGRRLRQAGCEVWYEPASRVLHHGSASHGRTPSPEWMAQQSCNEERLFWRHLAPAASWRFIPLHAVLLLGKAWLRWQEDRLRPFLAGRLAAWGELCLAMLAWRLPSHQHHPAGPPP